MVPIIDRHAGGPYDAQPGATLAQKAHYAASDLRLF
jgi:hypothetical protein